MPSMRPTRKSSRTSSPFVRTSNISPAPGFDVKKEKAQTSLDGWIEPPLQNPTPSFEDHGFARHGVLENMAPLGIPPSAKLKARLRGDTHRRSMLSKNEAMSAGEEALSTPEMTPIADPEVSEGQKPEEVLPPPLAIQYENEDDEYVPNGVRSASRSAKSAVKNGVATVTPVRDASGQGTPSSKTSIIRQRLQIVINDAVKRAQVEDRPMVGEALKQLYEESFHKQNLADLLDAIMHERQTQEQLSEFQVYIKRAKKQAKTRERRSLDRRASILGHSPSSTAKRRHSLTPSKSANTIATIPTIPTTPTPGLSILSSESNPLSHPPLLPPNVIHTSRSTRSRTPRKQSAPNGELTPQLSGMASSPRDSLRSGSAIVDSDSELSEVNEDIVQNVPPELLPLNGTTSTMGPKAAKSKNAAQSHSGPARGGKKSKSASAKQSAPASGKRSADEAGMDEEEAAAIQVKRQKMLQTLPDFSPEISDMRSQDDESYISNGPLTFSAQLPPQGNPRRSGRSRNGVSQGPVAADDGGLETPGLAASTSASAATTRPTTPLLTERPAKRQRRAGKAKTKHS